MDVHLQQVVLGFVLGGNQIDEWSIGAIWEDRVVEALDQYSLLIKILSHMWWYGSSVSKYEELVRWMGLELLHHFHC